MKVFDLLHSLTNTEKKVFDGVMNNHGREQIKNLYQYVRKTPRHQINNERMYEATYGHKYTKDKDYLLRNELRLLTNELKNMLVKLELEKELKQNPNTANKWYLKALKARGLNEHYESEYEKLATKASNELQFKASMEMSQDYMLYLSDNWASHLDFERISNSLENYRNQVIQYSGNAMRFTDLNQALFTRVSAVVNSKKRDIVPFTSFVEQIEIHPNDAYSEAMKQMTLAYMSQGDTRKDHLEKALELLDNCNYPGIPIERHLAGCYNSLTIYYLENEHKDLKLATHFAEKAFKAIYPDGPNLSVIFANYLRVLGQANDHEKIRAEFDKYHGHFKNDPNYPIIITGYMEWEAVNGDPDKAMELLPLISTKENINYNSYKMVLISAYLRKGLLELAFSEINNTLQSGRENNVDEEVMNFFTLVRLLIKTQMQDEPKAQDLKKLLFRIESITPQMLAIVRRTVVFNWYWEQTIELLATHNMYPHQVANT